MKAHLKTITVQIYLKSLVNIAVEMEQKVPNYASVVFDVTNVITVLDTRSYRLCILLDGAQGFEFKGDFLKYLGYRIYEFSPNHYTHRYPLRDLTACYEVLYTNQGIEAIISVELTAEARRKALDIMTQGLKDGVKKQNDLNIASRK